MHIQDERYGTPTVIQALRGAIERSELTRQEIAARAGISRRALYGMLEAGADPRQSTVEAIAHVLGLSLIAIPKIAIRMQLDQPTSSGLSKHSRVRRMLAEAAEPRDKNAK